MALHKDFPESPCAILDPALRRFPADEARRETGMDKLMPPSAPELRKKVKEWRDRGDNLFGLIDVRFGKELANKRGLVSLEVTNLTNRRFFQALERFREFEPDFSPSRRILFKLALYY